jgi:hypothetical protein
MVVDMSRAEDLSGRRYVAAHLRGEDYRAGTRMSYARIPLAGRRGECDHCETICADSECIESWGIDYRLYLQRTSGGRALADESGLSASAVQALSRPTRESEA